MLGRLWYRAKQFFFSLTAQYTPADDGYARSYLNIQEMALFNQLPGLEKKHSVVVAQKMAGLATAHPELDQRKLIRLGLLHDIGKVLEHNSVWTKSWLVIFRYFCPALFNYLADQGKTNLWLRRLYVHKHHGAIGAELLAKIGSSAEYLAVICKHDPLVEPFLPEDPVELKILQQADSTY